jgi:uncharacterized membrane protein HdeD (DUF308 family)
MVMRSFRTGREPVRMVSRSTLAWRGVLAVVLGLIAVIWPGITLGAFVILFAVYALIAAGIDTVRAFSSRRVGPVLGYLLLALISVAAAVAALAWPGITILVATVWIAVWAAVTGFTDLFLTFAPRERAGQRLMWALTGIIALIFAFVLVVRPIAGAVALATIWGFFSIFYGFMAITQAAQHPHEATEQRARSPARRRGPGLTLAICYEAAARCGSFQPGRTKWHVYPSG